MSKHHDQNEKRVARAKRDLERVAGQSDTIGTSSLSKMAGKMSDRMNARDVNQSDPIEVLGARIGRGLGVVVVIGLSVYLLFTYVLK